MVSLVTLIGSAIAFQGIKVPLKCPERRVSCPWSNARSWAPSASTSRQHYQESVHARGLFLSAASSDEAMSSYRRVHLPMRVPWCDQVQIDLEMALDEIVAASPAVYGRQTGNSCETFGATSHQDWKWVCIIPAFGDDCQLSLKCVTPENGRNVEGLLLTLEGLTVRDSDWHWLCSQFQEADDVNNNGSGRNQTARLNRLVSTKALRQVLVHHYNRQPADPGSDASTAAWSMSLYELDFERSFLKGADTLQSRWETLQANGYIVIDQPPMSSAHNVGKWRTLTTSSPQHEALSSFLQETTGQGPLVRTDRVHFVSRPQAVACGIGFHYDFCMGLAHCWNSRLQHDHDHKKDPVTNRPQPMFPATMEAPYTIPRNLQFAEYGPGDFYTAHSDNSLTSEKSKSNVAIRSNFRAYTCILYMNDNDWDVERHGGALRLYPHSQHFATPSDAIDAAASARSPSCVDISPINGRLLIFDSCLVHSVQPNLSSSKRRRALTLWINRPTHSGVRGEHYY